MKLRVGILLAGCGALDGSDPQEVVLLQLAFEELGHQTVLLSLDRPQAQVVDPTTLQQFADENRNQFLESQRLVRGKLHLLGDISPGLLDVLVLPGGQGPIQSWIRAGEVSEPRRVLPEVEEFIRLFREKGGVLGAISLSEFIATALEGEWPGGRGCLDLAPEEILVDAEKGRALFAGNLLAEGLPQLHRGMRNFASELVGMSAKK